MDTSSSQVEQIPIMYQEYAQLFQGYTSSLILFAAIIGLLAMVIKAVR